MAAVPLLLAALQPHGERRLALLLLLLLVLLYGVLRELLFEPRVALEPVHVPLCGRWGVRRQG